MSTAAAELRAASARLRALTKAIHAPDLTDQSWHVEECASEERGDCPCIVAQGVCNTDGPFVTPVYYVADAETPELAAYIAAMGPPVGAGLADWLDEEADRRDACLVAAIQIWGDAEHPDAVAWLTTGLGKGSARALTLARLINTGSQP